MGFIINTSIKAALLQGTSNILAQILTAYQSGTSVSINFVPVFHFMLYNLLSTPMNCILQSNLESFLPGRKPAPSTPQPKGSSKPPPEGELNIRNTLLKVLIDQTLLAAINVALFLFAMTIIKGGTVDQGTARVKSEWAGVMKAGWKIWPMVSIANFAFVPPESRVIVGSMVGVGWGIFLSLIAAER